MDLQLTGKRAIVSGSTKGIGLAIATSLAREGAQVVINGRTAGSVDAALAGIRAAVPGATLVGFAGDLGEAECVAGLVAQHPDTDILVNNLGRYGAQPFETSDDAEWETYLQVNVMSGVRLSRAYLPGMKQRNWGRIVFISSESGIQIPAEMIHYGVTKAAQLALSRGLAETCAGTGVTVNAVLPGPTRSEGVNNFVRQLSGGATFEDFERDFFRKVRPSSLLRRFEAPEEIAHMVTYVCSPLSSGTNGAALRVDGGVVRSCF
ncbi:MAG TPA: SDR family oxidoreductase [Steroidobacteraceae bacterium]|nr:SDR family oxidoreductase [Steroidobacteraceae bacterium]